MDADSGKRIRAFGNGETFWRKALDLHLNTLYFRIKPHNRI